MQKLVINIAERLKTHAWKLTTAESCTGGGLAYVLTELAGSSDWFERGFVTYSNLAKMEMLGVKPKTLDTFGAVSGETAQEMAQGALNHSQAQVSIAITGIAGPGGGSPEKPVGTVWFSWAGKTIAPRVQLHSLTGNRLEIRKQAIEIALSGLVKLLLPLP